MEMQKGTMMFNLAQYVELITPHAKKVICDGIIFNTITDCCEKYNIKPNAMCNWLKGKYKMPEEFKRMGLAYWNGGDAR